MTYKEHWDKIQKTDNFGHICLRQTHNKMKVRIIVNIILQG